jgi:hypothetical protein
MGTQDISRNAFDPRKRYKNVQMQMGRVLIDDDWNENIRLTDEDQRRAWVDVIGPAGSPDDGFRVSNVGITPNGKINFDLAAGSFYLGGMRLELFEGESYQGQKDWLQKIKDLLKPEGGCEYLVTLETYLQEVCAVEDSELFEAALGGPDTTTRQRVMQRVHLDRLGKNSGQWTCDQAWQAVIKKKWSGLNPQNELVPDSRLTVGYINGGTGDNLCSPTVASGYLGAENQAIRVQIADGWCFTWGFDNASPLYRIQLSADRKTATLTTRPKDQAHWPLAGTVVEVLPWTAVLPNNEKIAAIQGHLTKVQDPYNPEDGTLSLVDAVPTLGFENEYYYLRVWERGSDNTSPAKIDFTPGTEVPLGNTGLKITLDGTQFLPGDYWVIAARPDTPDQVVPWELETGRPPHGLRRFYAPLAIIRWPANGTLADVQVDDCRPHFRPLTRQNICCTYTVGDGIKSHGDFDSLAQALQQLPSSGGRICLLPGLHQASVDIANRENITITGCGRCSKVIPDEKNPKKPLFSITDSQDITLREMEMDAYEGTAILAEGSQAGKLDGLKVLGNRLMAYQNAIYIRQGQDVLIEHNIIRMLDKAGGGVAIYIFAEDARIEHNDISVVPPDVTPSTPGEEVPPPNLPDPCVNMSEFHANSRYILAYANLYFKFNFFRHLFVNPYNTLGGIQVGSGSERINILENTITGGAGNGITLGSDLVISQQPAANSSGDDIPITIPFEKIGVQGYVTDGKKRLPGVTILFTSGNQTETVISDNGTNPGYFSSERVMTGEWKVTSGDLSYRVKSVTLGTTSDYGTAVTIADLVTDLTILVELKKVETNLAEVFDFIYDLTINDNQIFHMGESGIGFPRTHFDDLKMAISEGRLAGIDQSTLGSLQFLLLVLGGAVGFVVNLHIQDNFIRECLRNQFILDTKEPSDRLRGVGGISLALCSGLVIRENRIELNGTSYLGPVQGIFIGYGTELDVSNNQVLNNGPAQHNGLQSGLPGGITILISSVSDQFLSENQSAGANISLVRQALRVHDNLVQQPVGRALTAMALGPVSVANNHLVTWCAVAQSDLVQSTVSTFGGSMTSREKSANPAPTTWVSAAVDAGTVLVLNAGQAAAIQQKDPFNPQYPALPTGSTLFNDNQVRLASAGNASLSLTIFSMDDVSISDNQSEILAEDELVLNSLAFGLTTRALSNRMQEPYETNDAKLSLFTYGVFYNTTTANQGNHCIIAQGSQVFEFGNFPGADICKRRSEVLKAAVSQRNNYMLLRRQS